MNLFQALSDFFESIFNRNSPEVQKKIQLRKLESEMRSFQPQIFQEGNLNGNFAETIRLLYVNSKPLNDLFLSTIASPDGQKAHRFEAQLVLTGFRREDQIAIQNLSYEARKHEFEESSMTTSQIFDRQRRTFDKVMHELNADVFRKIDKNLLAVHQFSDLCRFNFVPILQTFDQSFIAADMSYQPTYHSIPVSKIAASLEDLYFQANGLKFTASLVNAVSALATLKTAGEASNQEIQQLVKNLKTIAYIFGKILTPEKLKTLIRYGRQDILYEPKSASYKESACHSFEIMIQSKFKADEQRIKTELKDENIRTELSQLFGDTPLIPLQGYNNEFNQKLLNASQGSFLWILPMQILKTFLTSYFTESVRSLLNDIVIEGFFNNPTYKTEFSTDVYAALETNQILEDFEASFANGGKYSLTLLNGYLQDGKKDIDFLRKLEGIVSDINNEASKLITKETNNLNRMYKHIGDMLTDSKKPKSEIISNLKVLMMSSRNRDNTAQLEQQYENWEIFFKIMKNYAIISA